MKRFYSQETGCTYLEGIHHNMPSDAVELPEEIFQEVIANPAIGKMRKHKNGLPYLVDEQIEPPSLEQIRASRAAAYRLESDPLKIEADYDAAIAGNEPDYKAWIAKVEEIKLRFPLPS